MVLTRCMTAMWTGLDLIQEPWVHRERICDLGGCGTVYKGPLEKAFRAYIAVKSEDALLVPSFCTRDLTVVKVRLKGSTEG